MHKLLSFSRTISVPLQGDGLRLDRFLVAALPELSRTRLQSLIESGHVGKEGVASLSPSQKVKEGETYWVNCPPLEDPLPQPQEIPLHVVYEDEDVIVIDKPAGMVVHPAPGHQEGTLVNALLAHCGPSLSGISGVKRPGIVHRLDKGTSGLLVVAKHDQAHHFLSAQFENRTLSRLYLAFVWGVPSPPTGHLTGFIGRHPVHRQKMAIRSHGGKEAHTFYEVLEAYGNVGSLVQCRLGTGRTHQIRVHLAALRHSVMGDSLYGRPPTNLPPALQDILRTAFSEGERQALHATKLTFHHPRLKKDLCFESPLPKNLLFLQKHLREI